MSALKEIGLVFVVMLCVANISLAVTTTTTFVTYAAGCSTSTTSGKQPPLKTFSYTTYYTSTRTSLTSTVYDTSTSTPGPVSSTQTQTTTVSGRGGTQTITAPITSTSTLRILSYSISNTYVFSTVTTTGKGGTVSYGTAPGFTPLASVIADGVAHPPPSADVTCATAVYEYDDTYVDGTVRATRTTTLPQSTVTWTTTSTSFTANPATATITSFSGTHTNTVTVTDTTTITSTSTSIYTTNVGPPPTVSTYAACAPNNLITNVKGGPIRAYGNYTYLTAKGTATPEDCCNFCQATPGCGGFGCVQTGFCIIFKAPRTCNGAVKAFGFYTNASSPYVYTFGDGPCGQGEYNGQYLPGSGGSIA